MRGSNAFLVACVAAAVVVTAYHGLIKPTYRTIAYDDRPGIRFHQARLQQTTLKAGSQEIAFSFSYEKRPECHPPKAPPGLIRFRIWTGEKDWIWLRFENYSHAPALSGRHEMPFRSIPIPSLNPGTYKFQWVATYQCAGSSGPHEVESPKLSFEIIP